MNWRMVALTLGLLILSSAHAQSAGPIRVIVGDQGTCRLLELAGQKVPCVTTKGVMYNTIKQR